MAFRQAYRFRLYPDDEQVILMRKSAGCRRFVRNLCLEQIQSAWASSVRHRISAIDQIKELPALKRDVPWLREVPNHVLQQAVRDLHDGLTRFFKGQNKFPKFHRKGGRDSFRFPDAKQFRWTQDAVFLPKLGNVRWAMHREVIGKPKNVTVSRVADRWFASVLVERPEEDRAQADSNNGPAVGVDLNVVDSLVTSDGQVLRLPRVSPKEWAALAAHQRRLARRTKGSANRRRTRNAIARMHARWARRRDDAIEKATTTLSKNHGLVVVEDLRVDDMTKSAKGTVEEPGKNVAQKAGLNRAWLDVAPATTRRLLTQKAQRFGGRVVAVPAPYTSVDCSKCHNRDVTARNGDRFTCVACGHADNAHANASRNILAKGLALAA